MSSIQELREQRSKLAAEANDLVNGDVWDKATEEKVDGLLGGVDDLDSQISKHQKVLDVAAQNEQVIEQVSVSRGVSIDEAQNRIEGERILLNAFMRGGEEMVAQEIANNPILNTMSTTTDSEGGYTVPTATANAIIDTMKAYGGMRSVATVITTADGSAIDFPTNDETAVVGELVAENTEVASADASFGIKTIAAWKYSSKDVTVPFELLQDNVVDLESWIVGALGVRLGRITNQHFTTGTGSSQPNGCVTASGEGKVGTTGQTLSVIYDDLVDLYHSVNSLYRGNALWQMADSSLKVIKKLKDGDSRPLWIPGVASADPDTILGKGYVINDDMATMAANAKSIMFGDFGKYLIRDSMPVSLFRMTDSAYTRKGQVGFLSFMRTDGELLDVAAVKHYKNSAT
jgi:HK97 family phage major capsid protein